MVPQRRAHVDIFSSVLIMHLNYNHSPSHKDNLVPSFSCMNNDSAMLCPVSRCELTYTIAVNGAYILLDSPYSIHVNRCPYMYMKVGRDKKHLLGGKAYFQEIGTLTLLKPSQCYKAYLYSQLCRQGQTGGRHCCRGGTWSC